MRGSSLSAAEALPMVAVIIPMGAQRMQLSIQLSRSGLCTRCLYGRGCIGSEKGSCQLSFRLVS